MGEHQRLRDTRMFFQYATVDQFTSNVEQITGHLGSARLARVSPVQASRLQLALGPPGTWAGGRFGAAIGRTASPDEGVVGALNWR